MEEHAGQPGEVHLDVPLALHTLKKLLSFTVTGSCRATMMPYPQMMLLSVSFDDQVGCIQLLGSGTLLAVWYQVGE